jgi:hypothetical protein
MTERPIPCAATVSRPFTFGRPNGVSACLPPPYAPHTLVFAALPAAQFASAGCGVHGPSIDGEESTTKPEPPRQKQQQEP